MSVHSMHHIDYSHAEIKLADGVEFDELEIPTDGKDEAIVSEISKRKIGIFLSKIERYVYRFQYNAMLSKLDPAQLIPSYVMFRFANRAFGYDGWKTEILYVKILDCVEVDNDEPAFNYKIKYSVRAEAAVKLTLKDGLNSEFMCKKSCLTHSKGESFGRAKKVAVTYAIKKAFLNLGNIVLPNGHTIN